MGGNKLAAYDGGEVSPGIVADFRRGRYALPMGMSVAEILAASPSEILSEMRECKFSDVMAFTRASTGSHVDSSGNVIEEAINTPRFDYSTGKRRLLLEAASANQLPYSGNAGAAVGTLGTGGTGTLPTGVTISLNFAGLTIEITAIGETGGVPWTEYRIHGTNNSGAKAYPDIRPAVPPSAAVGQTWTYSFYAALIAGSWPVASSAGHAALAEFGGSYLASTVGKAVTGWGRYSASRTLTQTATTTTIRGYISLEIGIGETVDFTFRMGGLQLEQQASATSYIPTNGGTRSRVADSCKLTPRAAAVLQRTSGGVILQGDKARGAGGRLIGAASYSRLIGFNGTAASIVLGADAPIGLAAVTTPLPEFGVAGG